MPRPGVGHDGRKASRDAAESWLDPVVRLKTPDDHKRNLKPFAGTPPHHAPQTGKQRHNKVLVRLGGIST